MDLPAFETLKIELDGALGRLVMNRPGRLNAIGATTLNELLEAARWFDRQIGVRVVIVSGAGRAFSAGADIKDRPSAAAMRQSGKSWFERRNVPQLGLRAMDAIEQMHAVTIAQVQGYAVGGALVLMSACDLRVVSQDAVFLIPEVDLGIPLAWGGIPRLVRELGPALTRELVMTCRPFSAEEAHRLGFVNRVVAPAQLEAEALALAREILSKPPVPIAITKDHVTAVMRATSTSALSVSDGDVFMGLVDAPESQAAARAHAAKALGKRR